MEPENVVQIARVAFLVGVLLVVLGVAGGIVWFVGRSRKRRRPQPPAPPPPTTGPAG